jgi:hypothetical protein
MEETPHRGLGPWVLGPLVLGVILFFAMALLPSTECGNGEKWLEGPGRIAFGSVALAATIAVVAGGVVRLVQMSRWGLYREVDTWLLGGAVLVLSVVAGIAGSGAGDGEGALAGLLGGGFVLAVLCFPAMIVAAFREKTADEVGILVTIYLFGAGMAYLLVAWVVLDLNASGGLC